MQVQHGEASAQDKEPGSYLHNHEKNCVRGEGGTGRGARGFIPICLTAYLATTFKSEKTVLGREQGHVKESCKNKTKPQLCMYVLLQQNKSTTPLSLWAVTKWAMR